jgi:hypothetical protein
MESAYLEAIRSGDREKFAHKYGAKQLGASVFLELGDEAYGRKDYVRAEDYYHRARRGLGHNIFAGRAAIGESVALIKSGRVLEGESLLARVGEERSYPLSVRGNALYLLAVSIHARGDRPGAKDVLNGLINSNFPTHWKEEAGALLSEMGIEQ